MDPGFPPGLSPYPPLGGGNPCKRNKMVGIENVAVSPMGGETHAKGIGRRKPRVKRSATLGEPGTRINSTPKGRAEVTIVMVSLYGDPLGRGFEYFSHPKVQTP